MKREIPMLFSDAMVIALLERRKTQTRRLTFTGKAGDEIWVKEAWAKAGEVTDVVEYRADNPDPTSARWRPSIFMPRVVSRLWLRVVDVRVELLQTITHDDARAEGFPLPGPVRTREEITETDGRVIKRWVDRHYFDPVTAFAYGWEAINGKRASWLSNPEVHVVTFEEIVRYGRAAKGGSDADRRGEALF